MRLLSIHSMGHDAGIALFDDGELRFTVEAERLTRQRHEPHADTALAHLFDVTGIRPESIDEVIFSTNVRGSLAAVDGLETLHASIENGALEARGVTHMLGSRKPCTLVAHEAAHAALSAHEAGWPDGLLVLVNEGRGTFSRNSLFLLRNCKLTLVEQDALPWFGTGFGWSAIGYLLGLGKTPSAAGTMMAMAAYGQQCRSSRDLILNVDRAFADSPRELQAIQAQPLIDFFDSHPKFEDRASFVLELQRLFTETVVAYCVSRASHYGATNIALGGGCALNLPTNLALREIYPAITIPPNCNDSGQALGAALYILRTRQGIAPRTFPVYSCGVPLQASRSLTLAPFRTEQVLQWLLAGEPVAWMKGTAELGPRALGHRSLLGSTRICGMKKRISEEIKQRQWFRPLACILREETFAKHFPGELPSPYMLFPYAMPKGIAPEVTHADGTCRIQTIGASDHPLLNELLEVWEQQTGEIGLINTSLNSRGNAIAYTVEDAIADLQPRGVTRFVANEWIST